MFDKKARDFAAQKLGLSAEWELVYLSVQSCLIYDAEGLVDQIENRDLHDDYAPTIGEIVDDAITYVDLPPGFRVVGMDNPPAKERKFGVVDFTELGAA